MVGDDEVGVEFEPFAQPVARGTRALRSVEAEQPRFDLGDREARDGAGEFFGEDQAVGRDARALELLLGCALISVRIERRRDAPRWCTAARCLYFARPHRI